MDDESDDRELTEMEMENKVNEIEGRIKVVDDESDNRELTEMERSNV